ncbi:MAG: phenylalanine--tRNA ligase subunit beta [Firmicutes bacterium]|nr:phenylalanine--tRNA ligase subunit beta [Bacillota bacterium]
MLVPYEWLKEFVPELPAPNEVARELTLAGVAVEALAGDGARAVFDFEITHNRPDLLSVLGIAREAAAVFSLALRHPELAVVEDAGDAHETAAVKIEASDLCRRYAARVVTDVEIRPSPDWMQARLEAAGVRPVNNIVDVTNYVMLEVGQPLHAFDLDLLAGRRIVVRRAAPGEWITTIDGERRSLDEDILVIADSERPVAIAGVMGGMETEVSERTRTVLLESANFDGVSVWRASRALRMRTEASSRFSRGLWPENARIGVERAASLIQAIGAGKVARGMLDAYPGQEDHVFVRLRPQRVNLLLGTDIREEDMKDILMRLGFIVEPWDGGSYRVLVPDHRPDVSREEDLVEEIARLYGYDRIEATLPKGAPPEVRRDAETRLASKAGEILRSCGLSEVETITFTNLEACRALRLAETEVQRLAVKISNPLSSDYTMLRMTLLTSLLDVLKRNAAHREDDVAIYEIARVYLKREREDSSVCEIERGDGPRSRVVANDDLLPCEPVKVGLAIMGRLSEPSWERKAVDAGFFDLKGIVEALLEGLGLRRVVFSPWVHPSLHPGRTAKAVVGDGPRGGEDIGFLGELHPDVREAFGLRKRVFVAELDLKTILAAREPALRVKPPARFPAVTRDLAVVVRREVASSDVERVMASAATGLVEALRLFDVYEGPQVPEGHKSLAFSITYRSPERTLTDEEVEKAHRAVSRALAERLGATVRA